MKNIITILLSILLMGGISYGSSEKIYLENEVILDTYRSVRLHDISANETNVFVLATLQEEIGLVNNSPGILSIMKYDTSLNLLDITKIDSTGAEILLHEFNGSGYDIFITKEEDSFKRVVHISVGNVLGTPAISRTTMPAYLIGGRNYWAHRIDDERIALTYGMSSRNKRTIGFKLLELNSETVKTFEKTYESEFEDFHGSFAEVFAYNDSIFAYAFLDASDYEVDSLNNDGHISELISFDNNLVRGEIFPLNLTNYGDNKTILNTQFANHQLIVEYYGNKTEDQPMLKPTRMRYPFLGTRVTFNGFFNGFDTDTKLKTIYHSEGVEMSVGYSENPNTGNDDFALKINYNGLPRTWTTWSYGGDQSFARLSDCFVVGNEIYVGGRFGNYPNDGGYIAKLTSNITSVESEFHNEQYWSIKDGYIQIDNLVSNNIQLFSTTGKPISPISTEPLAITSEMTGKTIFVKVETKNSGIQTTGITIKN